MDNQQHMASTPGNKQQMVRVNYYIKSAEVRVISDDGTNFGVLKLADAIKQAKDLGLDLVEINGKSNPPVCKIIELGKFKYEEKKKQNEAKKKNVVSELKEIQLRPATNSHDIETKVRSAQKFLEDGHRVKFTVRYRGRELSHMELGYEQLKNILSMLGEKIVVLAEPKVELKTVSMTIGKEK